MRVACICGLLLVTSCGHFKRPDKGVDAGVTQVPLDRLLPSELNKSSLLVFGFPIPQGMQVKNRYPDSVVLSGSVPAALLFQYVETHAVVTESERIGRRKIYKNAKVRSAEPNRSYTIEVSDLPSERLLTIADTTPRPLRPGLSDEERWRRAGYLPSGQPIASAQSM